MRLVASIVLTSALMATNLAFAQTPGNTGGTVGKQDKSASGGVGAVQGTPKASAAPAEAAQAASKSSCRNVVGTWRWYLGLSETTYLADGTARHSSGVTGTWKCVGPAIAAVWTNGVNEHDTLSPDGNSLFVNSTSNGGVSFVATRESH